MKSNIYNQSNSKQAQQNKRTQLNKKSLILLIMFLFQFSSFSQVVCGGTFTDNGGAINNY